MLFMPLFQSFSIITLYPRGDALRFAQRLPLAAIFRAFGAALLNREFEVKPIGNDIDFGYCIGTPGEHFSLKRAFLCVKV